MCKHYVQKSPAAILDYGCGMGWLLHHLMAWYDVSGYEVSAFALKEARKNAPHARFYPELQAIPHGIFDLVVSLHVLEHVSDPAVTLHCLAEYLKPGGILFFVVPAWNGLGHRIKQDRWFAFRDPTHISLLPEQEWLRLTMAAGLHIVKQAGDGLWDAPYFPVLPRIVQWPLCGWYAALQVYLGGGRLFIPPAWSECLLVIAQK